MPELEPVICQRQGSDSDAILKTGVQNPPPLEQKVHYGVPMEMRSLFLLHMLKDCFKDGDWLFSVSKVVGKVGLLVMESMPQTPYFWAIILTKECYQKMQKLFTDLGAVESRLPFLTKKEAQRGMRCLAECTVGDEGKAWNRCWIFDKIEDLAVVFFVDFGCSAMLPLTSLRKLDMDEFWSISPLAQPFMLQDEVLPSQIMMRQILEGTVVGPLEREPQILKFTLQAH
ncbi:tudor domain-containing protein 10 [Sceloporus undulatus]|uniref:tudor domain-containing protein 10 n=1 Tax=Sceloporus undulatus TaxID=8520 RepID=UPI001C4CABBB|nr:tudor domain-containing protein 10 [Sceloporus undulatus]